MVCSVYAGCSQESPSGNTRNGNNLLVFEDTVHDFGTIDEGSDGTWAFTFTNKGDVPVILSDVRSSCGCTTPEWPREPIAAGEKGTIKVKYNTAITGSFSKSISVYTASEKNPIVLVIKGNVRAAQ